MKTRNVAVIGAGYWGRHIVKTLHNLGVLACVADASQDILNELKITYPHLQVYSSYEDIPSEVNIYVVATPVVTHYSIAKKLLSAGKDVFVEKPLTLHVSEAQELLDIAITHHCILMVGHLLMYQPAIQFIKKFMTEGKLGEIYSLHQTRCNLGRIRRDENALYSLGVHDVAVLSYLISDHHPVVTIEAQSALQPAIEDDVKLHLSYPSGVIAHLHVCWLWPRKERHLMIIGKKGALFYDELSQKVFFYEYVINSDLTITQQEARIIFEGSAEPLLLEMQHFLECVKTRKAPLSSGQQGIEVLTLLQQATFILRDKKMMNLYDDVMIHETALVDKGALIGEGSRIWHWVHISKTAIIGKNCSLGQNVYVADHVKIGNQVKIQNNVSVYEGVEIEDDVFCGPSMVFTNVHNPRAAIERKHEYRKTLIKKGATLGANCTIVCGVTIGCYAFVGAGAVVTCDLPDYALVMGVPARQIGWMSKEGVRLDLPLKGGGESVTLETGGCYKLTAEGRCVFMDEVAA